MSNIDVRTDAERERDAKHQSIVADYLELWNKHKGNGYKPNRFINIVADQYGMSGGGVRKILEAKGVI